MKFLILFLTLILITPTMGCNTAVNKYDTLVEKDEACSEALGNINSNMQRRSDLIPNLVSVAKAAAGSENKILKEVMEARSKATAVTITPSDLENEAKMKEYVSSQSALGSSLSRLMMVQEQYPELKSNENFRQLQSQIEGTENRILIARKRYNEKVKEFNVELRRVGGKIINPLTGNEFKPKVYFQADEAALAAPKVEF